TAGTGGSGGSAGTGVGGAGGTGLGGFGGLGGSSVCQPASIVFQPLAPTVYVLVERSGSMYTCLSTGTDMPCGTASDTAWGIIKEAVRTIVAAADAQARFGFATAWGTNPATGGMCPSQQGLLTDNVPPAVANGTAVMAKYDSLPSPSNSTQQGVKFES